VNSDSYSISTSQHQSTLRSAINHKKQFYVNTEVLKKFLWSQKFDKAFKDALIKDALSQKEDALKSAAKRRKNALKVSDINEAKWAMQNAIDIFEFFGKKPPVAFTREFESLKNDTDQVLSDHADALEKERKAQAIKDAKEQKEQLKLGLLWQEFKECKGFTPYHLKKTLMRVNGDVIETSKNAQFPVEDAKQTFVLIRKIKEKSKFDIHADQITSDFKKLGHYSIDTIYKNGDVKAGCHFVEWDQIERCAIELKIYP
jgi:hypothetical protein